MRYFEADDDGNRMNISMPKYTGLRIYVGVYDSDGSCDIFVDGDNFQQRLEIAAEIISSVEKES